MPLTSTNLKYKGAFRVPAGTSWQNQMINNYGGSAIAFNPANNSLFIVGHDWTQCVSEVTIPELKMSSYNVGTFIQQPRILSIQSDEYDNNIKFGGLYVENGNLYGTRYVYYDASVAATRSHFKLNGTNLNQVAQGLYTVQAPNPGWVAGYIQPIPAEHRSKFGGKTHLTGMGGLSIISRTSSGPSAFAFNLSDLGINNPVSSVPMVGYDVDHPLGGSISNALYNLADSIRGVVFPEGSDTVLFFGVHGEGQYCYGTGAECNDPDDNSKGVHAYPYVPFVWAYSVNDLADVAAGRKQMHQILPTATWKLPEVGTRVSHAANLATTYDPITKRLFIAEKDGDSTGEALPLIHVYEIEVNPGEPIPDVTPPTFTVTPINITATEADITVNNISEQGVVNGIINGEIMPAINVNAGQGALYEVSGLDPDTTYLYSITVTDIANNSATLNGSFMTPSAPPVDTIAPLVSNLQVTNITDKTATVTWTTDEPSITKLTYNGTVSENTTLKTSHSVSLTNLTQNTSYSCVVTTQDGLGNNNTVAGNVNFTTKVTSTEPANLISKWSFSESSGTTTLDNAGRSGTISGALRVTGKSGNALSFDGVNDRVNIADGNYLDFTNNFTLAAWVYPRKNTGWQTILLKERSGGLCYALYASDDNGKPNAYINIGGGDVGVVAPNALPLNQWTHIAFTYSSGTARLYINGVLVRTLAVSGTVTTSTGAFRFGGNAVWSEWLNGNIDEVRLYNRALSASEIATLVTL